MNARTPNRGHHLLDGGRRFASGNGWFLGLFAERFHRALDRIDAALSTGRIEAFLPDGSFRILGGRADGPVAEVRLNSWRALVRLAQAGSVGWYVAWERREWESPDPVPLFDLFMRHRAALGDTARAKGWTRRFNRIAHVFHGNSIGGARRNVTAHYDLGNDFYAVWLDATMSYSSAMFLEPSGSDQSLEQAQHAKMSAVADRLNLKAGDTVLEIGCGWGALATHLARHSDLAVTAITISKAQADWARHHHADAAPRVAYRVADYRQIKDQYDAIASVEMVEAVGQRYWPKFVDVLYRSLKPGGRAVLQYIAIADDIFDRYAASADFIQTYIFPGGCLLSESRFRKIAEARGFEWCDHVAFGDDYAETLLRWRTRFDHAVEQGRLPPGFDQRFVDLWRYYLMYCEGGFRGGGITVAHVTLSRGE